MAQANSVQREPSMEEILASIRRIIEDNDTGRRPAVDFGQVRPEPEEERIERNVIEVEAFRAELQSKTVAPIAETRAEEPVRPEPIEAKVEPETPWPTIEPKRPGASEPTPSAAATAATPRITQSWTPSSTIAVEQMERLAGPARETVSPAVAPQPAAIAEPVAVAQPVVVPEPVASAQLPEAEPTSKAAIISEQAGRQVSAAFGELNDAYAARSRKSFDEIAADMLRPMLQDWLDNNLPTLVERLVREEIERVARGAQ